MLDLTQRDFTLDKRLDGTRELTKIKIRITNIMTTDDEIINEITPVDVYINYK